MSKEISIKNQINTKYRQYALYVIESRGIPNWYDSLSNVQRLILDNSPTSFSKTISIVGATISAGYAHGDASIVSSINKLARPFNCADNLIEGSGFFGNPVSPSAAAARYTNAKINPAIKSIIDKFRPINHMNTDGNPEYFTIDTPIGLSAGIVGIAVGYKSTILPRKLSDIKEFMEGKRKSVKPHFKGFTGKVSKWKNDNCWLIEGVIEIDDSKRTIRVTAIPPMVKFESFLKKLNNIVEDVNVDFTNRSKKEIDVQLTVARNEDKEVWNRVKEEVTKATKLIVHESIVFVRDKCVIEYLSIDDYLLDFADWTQKINLEYYQWQLSEDNKLLKYLESKLKFLQFMIEKKRNETEIDNFLSAFEKWIAAKLDSIKLRTLSAEEIQKTKNEISNLKNVIIVDRKASIKNQESIIKKIDWTLRGKQLKSAEALFEEDTDDGIEIFSLEEELDETPID